MRPIRCNTSKSRADGGVRAVVVATGVASVAVQLIFVREYLAQFQCNEIVIALIFFGWLVFGGIGAALAKGFGRVALPAAPARLVDLSSLLAVLSVGLVVAIRRLRDPIFLHGMSVGFYPTLAFISLTLWPYALLVGFVLPYSLQIIRQRSADYPGNWIYMADNVGDVAGGALFSLVLVHWLTPFKALFVVHLPLIVALWRLKGVTRWRRLAATGTALVILLVGVGFERTSLPSREGRRIFYAESRYGRIEVIDSGGERTLFIDGQPTLFENDPALAEELVHFPLAQLDAPRRLLLISSVGGMMAEVAKYHPAAVDYVELDSLVAQVQRQHGLLAPIPGLAVITEDAWAFLRHTSRVYDAILVNLPAPETYQLNRFFTAGFFSLAKGHLVPGGVMSLALEGVADYISPVSQRQLSSLANTAGRYFSQVTLMPGQRLVVICRDGPVQTDIADLLERRAIPTEYIQRYFSGELTGERIGQVNAMVDPAVPPNLDLRPYLMQLAFEGWLLRHGESPVWFGVLLAVMGAGYLTRISRPQWVILTSGGVNIGAEMVAIFTFQVFYGYIYLQIGLLVTVFLSGLLPGAWAGGRYGGKRSRALMAADLLLCLLLVGYALLLVSVRQEMPPVVLYLFGWLVSFCCGFQFPLVLMMAGDSTHAAAGSISADLVGAAGGVLLVALVLIPFLGLVGASLCLAGLKGISLILAGTIHESP